LRAIKLPFTKRITIPGRDESKPRKAVSNLLRFLAAIITGGVNELGANELGANDLGANDLGADVVVACGPGWSGLG
jgi:hypothetical protein